MIYERSNYYGNNGIIPKNEFAVSALTGLPIEVAITLIAVIGLVAIVIMLMGYRFEKDENGRVVLEPA